MSTCEIGPSPRWQAKRRRKIIGLRILVGLAVLYFDAWYFHSYLDGYGPEPGLMPSALPWEWWRIANTVVIAGLTLLFYFKSFDAVPNATS